MQKQKTELSRGGRRNLQLLFVLYGLEQCFCIMHDAARHLVPWHRVETVATLYSPREEAPNRFLVKNYNCSTVEINGFPSIKEKHLWRYAGGKESWKFCAMNRRTGPRLRVNGHKWYCEYLRADDWSRHQQYTLDSLGLWHTMARYNLFIRTAYE